MTIESPDNEATATTPPETPAAAHAGFAIAALVVGVVAFMTGLAPVWGLLAGACAVVLGVIAVTRKQNKAISLIGLGLGALAVVASLITTIALIAGAGSVREPNAAPNPIASSPASTTPKPTTSPTATPKPTPTATPKPTPTATPKPTATVAPAPPKETLSQANARSSAQSYLSFTAFSRSGLIGQLEYEGFSTEDATYGADSVGADWNEQAGKAAQSYLDFTSFSRSGLIDQLVFDGFTQAEAEFGVTAVGY